MSATRNPYKIPYGFVNDPFVPLYQQLDEEVSYEPSAQALLDYARELEELVPGDFDLGEVITEIKSNTLSFVRTGLMAYRVKILKLYRKGYRSFKEFCEKAIGITHWQINRTIDAARVVMELAQNGFKVLPKNEAQARHLTKLRGADLYNSWERVVNSNPEHKITGRTIAETLGIEVKSRSVSVEPQVYDRLEDMALKAGMLSIGQYLKALVTKGDQIEEVDEEKIKAWEADLEALIAEQHFEDEVPIVTVSDRLDDIENEPIVTVSDRADELKSEPIVTVSDRADELKSEPIGKVSRGDKIESVPIGQVSSVDDSLTSKPLKEENQDEGLTGVDDLNLACEGDRLDGSYTLSTGDRPLGIEKTNDVSEESAFSQATSSVVTDIDSQGTTSVIIEDDPQALDEPTQQSTKKKSFLDFSQPSSKKKRPKRGFGR